MFAAVSLLAPLPAWAQASLDHLTLIAPAAPGGGWDQTARAMQHALQAEGIVRVVEVENITGAAGTIGLAHFVSNYQGRDDTVLVTGLVMLAAILWNDSPTTLAGVTPLAGLTGEPEVIAVPVGSPHRDMASLLTTLRANPGGVSWGGGSAGGTDHLLAGLILASAGVEPGLVNYIAFSGGGEAVTALLGGNVTAGVNGYSEVSAHIESGRLRALAISTPRACRASMPDLAREGIDIDAMNWRAVVAAGRLAGAAGSPDVSHLANGAVPTGSAPSASGLDGIALAGDAFDAFLWSERARVDRIVKGCEAARARPRPRHRLDISGRNRARRRNRRIPAGTTTGAHAAPGRTDRGAGCR
jgi:putative tricarboxylic transport membrane protein